MNWEDKRWNGRISGSKWRVRSYSLIYPVRKKQALIALGSQDLHFCFHGIRLSESLPITHNGHVESKVVGLVFLSKLNSVQDGLDASWVEPFPATQQRQIKPCYALHMLDFTVSMSLR